MLSFLKKNSFYINYKRIWAFVKPYWLRALLATLITIPIGALDAVVALALKPYMDTVVVSSGKTDAFPFPLWIIPVFIVLFTIIQSLLDYFSTYLNTWVGYKMTISLKEKLYHKLINSEAAFFDQTSSGDVVYRFDTDPTIACTGLLNSLKIFISRIVSSISLICVLLYTSWQLAIIAIVVLGASLWPLRCIRKLISEIVRKTTEATGSIITTYNETYTGAPTIASYNLQERQMSLFQQLQKYLFKLIIKQTQRTAWLSPLMHIIVSLGIGGVIYTGTFLISSGKITAGDFVSFLTAMLMLYTPIKNIGKNYNSVQLAFMAIERIFKILERPISITNKENAVLMKPLKNSIVFKDVSFAYSANKLVLQDINLKIKKGQTIAFVGNSGGGKSTIINLIPRFYDVNAGEISIDGVNVKDFEIKSLRNQIAIVFQNNFLFSGTIKENILLGNSKATDDEIKQSLKVACLEEFIASLEQGLDTPVGENGNLLSGGQKQRIAIARAFLKNASILILDEATSALDNKSEAIVQQAINNLMKDKTVFVIAHRLSTIQNADKIVVLNKGKIQEIGTHAELLQQESGAYKSLYMAQFRGNS